MFARGSRRRRYADVHGRMKRGVLIRHLRRQGCQLLREGRGHSIWINMGNGRRQTLPRHSEIKN